MKKDTCYLIKTILMYILIMAVIKKCGRDKHNTNKNISRSFCALTLQKSENNVLYCNQFNKASFYCKETCFCALHFSLFITNMLYERLEILLEFSRKILWKKTIGRYQSTFTLHTWDLLTRHYSWIHIQLYISKIICFQQGM